MIVLLSIEVEFLNETEKSSSTKSFIHLCLTNELLNKIKKQGKLKNSTISPIKSLFPMLNTKVIFGEFDYAKEKISENNCIEFPVEASNSFLVEKDNKYLAKCEVICLDDKKDIYGIRILEII